MSAEHLSTLERIHAAARDEFLEKGFQEASLRNIVKTAGVTTGAFYGYYGSKAELFRALVGEVYDTILATYQAALDAFASLPLEKQPEQMGKISRQCMKDMLQYMFAHRDACHLLLRCAEGTKYAFLIDEIVEREVDSTHKYYQTLAQLGQPRPPHRPLAGAHPGHRHDEGLFRDRPPRHAPRRRPALSGGAERLLHRRLGQDHGAGVSSLCKLRGFCPLVFPRRLVITN